MIGAFFGGMRLKGLKVSPMHIARSLARRTKSALRRRLSELVAHRFCAHRDVVSLRWGSHRQEYGLQRHVAYEKIVQPSELVWFRDPVLQEVRIAAKDEVTHFRLRDVDFDPSTGDVIAGARSVLESQRGIADSRPTSMSTEPPRPFPRSGSATAMQLSSNYYHFLLEDVTRLILLKHHGLIRYVATGAPLNAFQAEVLASLNLEAKHLRGLTRFDELQFVNIARPSGVDSAAAVKLLRESFLAEATLRSGTRRIYVSRRGSRRAFPDEPVIEQFLKGRGVEIIRSELLSVAEQIQVFSEAHTLIAPHGAGLANLIFMPLGSQVIELMSPRYANPCFSILSAHANVRYAQILADRWSTKSADIVDYYLKN